MAKPFDKKLVNRDLAEGFKVVGNPKYLHFSKAPFGEVNFETLTVKQAEKLVADGFPYLQKKAVKPATPETENEAADKKKKK